MKCDLRVPTRHQDRSVQRSVLAFRLQSLEQLGILVLRQHGLGQQRGSLARIVATFQGGAGLPLPGHGVAQLDRHTAKQKMGFGVLRVAAHRVAQIDLCRFQVTLLQ